MTHDVCTTNAAPRHRFSAQSLAHLAVLLMIVSILGVLIFSHATGETQLPQEPGIQDWHGNVMRSNQ